MSVAKARTGSGRRPEIDPSSLKELTSRERLRALLGADFSRGRSYWGLPARGLYAGGCITGSAAAMAYLKFLREAPSAEYWLARSLQNIVLDMFEGGANESLKGQVVGFLATIDQALARCVSTLEFLDDMTSETLSGEIQRGLAYSEADELAEVRRYHADAARRGWENRRRKAKAVSHGAR